LNNSLNNYKWFEHSSYWLDDETYKKVSKSAIPISELVSKHKIIKTITNFVDIINDEGSSKIKVQFAGSQAQTDGNTLTISSDVEDFDLLAGLSLHESSHLQYSKDHFRILSKIRTAIGTGGKATSDPEYALINRMFEHFRKMNISRGMPTEYICLLANFIEDQRIDSLVISRYPGYEPYYDAIDRKYVLSDDSMERILSETGETWKNYLMKLLLLIDENADLTILKGLSEISKTIDLPNINRLKGGKDVFELSFDIFKIIQKYVEQPKQQPKQQGDSEGDSEDSDSEQNQESNNSNNGSKSSGSSKSKTNSKSDKNDKSDDEDESENGSEDGSNGESEDEKKDKSKGNKSNSKNKETNEDEDESGSGNENESEDENEPEGEEPVKVIKPTTENDFDIVDGDEIMQKIVDALNNKFDKESMGKTEADAFELITNKSVLTRTVKYLDENVDTILIKDISNEKILNKFKITSLFNNMKPYSAYVERGIKKGKLLASRLSVMNDVKQIDAIRKEAGRLDQRLLPEFGHGNTKIFKTSTVGKYQDTNIHITIDSSGSMSGASYGNALEMATMFAVASLYIKGLTVQVSVRSTIPSILGTETPFVAIVFDTLENHDIKYIKKYMSKLNVHNLTPEGLTFAVIKDYIIERSKSRNSLFINVSDGSPTCYINQDGEEFCGEDAVKFTAKQVSDIAKSGIKVISFLIGNDEHSYAGRNFKSMYGNASQYIDIVQPLKVANVFNKEIKKA